MLHWAIAFGTMALIAAVCAAAGVAVGLSAALFWVFTSLYALALLTGACGRGRDGLYSAERAVMLAGGAAAAVFVLALFAQHDWQVSGVSYQVSEWAGALLTPDS